MYNQYYNPYMINGAGSGLSLLSRVRNINWGGFLNNTQRTLNVINQAIPIVNQVRPMVTNARTMFRVMKEVNAPDDRINTNSNTNHIVENNANPSKVSNTNSNKPQFFI